MKNSRFIVLILAVLLCVFPVMAIGCADAPPDPFSVLKWKEPTAAASAAAFLKTDGTRVRNNSGTGDDVMLRGVNIGGIFALEQWMNGFKASSSEDSDIVAIDHYTTSKVFMQRFGVQKTKELWLEYVCDWFSDVDFNNIADMGMNVIRLPFTYMTVDFNAIAHPERAGRNYDFRYLDWFVNKAAEYGIYTVLDLHGAYGSQNGKDHSGQVLAPEQVDFYSNETNQALTAKLWKAVAEHFKDNGFVAGYDILNEPAETTEDGTLVTEQRHWDVFDRIYKAIREVDKDHIVIFESCWDADNMPMPGTYGWENCMYSFHHYTGTNDFEKHKNSWQYKFETITAANFGVPIYMGEFNCYENEESWKYSLGTMNSYKWHWTNWTYKINNTARNSGWGIYKIRVEKADKIDAHNDPYDVIVTKFQGLQTHDNTDKFVFNSGRTLYELLQKFATA